MRMLRQPGEVAEQPPVGMRASGESEETERAGKRLRPTAAGSSAPSTAVRHESKQVEV